MKKIIAVCLLFVSISFAQNSEKKVWNLLLDNKREEARKVFDKELKSKIGTNVDYLILDGILDYEMGKLSFDDAFLKKFLSVCKQKEYLYPIWYKPYMMDNANANGYNDYTYKKIDLLASSELFSNDIVTIYFKGICDKKGKI